MERIKVLERNGKNIVSFDLSGIKTNDELCDVVNKAKGVMKCYSYSSVYTITNISGITFDSKTKEIAVEWMTFNKPYVINSAFIGVLGVRKIMARTVFALSNRTHIKLFDDMEQALAWIESL